MTSAGVYSQFKRALKGRHVMQAWGLATELLKVPLADALELLLVARDLEPACFDRGVPRWHARLCAERQLSAGEAQLALADHPGPGAPSCAGGVRRIHGWPHRNGVAREGRPGGRFIETPSETA